MTDNKELFENMKISKAVWTLALPTIMAMLVTIIYNVADTFFIGQTGDTNQVAAITLAMPVFMIMMSLGTLFGTGGSTTISRNLGEGRQDRINKLSSFSFYGSLAAGAVLGVLILAIIHPLTRALGASEGTSPFVISYLSFLAMGAPFVVVSNAFGSILRSDGHAKEAFAGMMIGTVTNLILDPILILVFNMGVPGAAVATVIGNITATGYYIVFMNSDKTIMAIKPGDFKIRDGIASDVVSIGFPSSLSSLFMSFAIMFLNMFLALYGDHPVAAMGVATKGNQIPAMLFGGFTMGVQPLLAYSYGAKDGARLKGLIRYTLTASVIMGIAASALFITIAPHFIRAFIADGAVVAQGTLMLRALMSTVVLLGVYFFTTTVNQAMNKPVSALVLTIARQGFVFIPALFIANALFGLSGLIWAQPIADVISVIIAALMLRKNIREMEKEFEIEKIPEPARAYA